MRLVIALLVVVATTTPAGAEDWPRWRGVRADGSWNAPPLPESWPTEGLRRLWSRPIGGGYAGLSVADRRLFTLDFTPRQPAPKEGPDGDERVVALSADTGEELWSYRYPVRYGSLGGYGNGPRSAPTVVGRYVYTLGAVGHLFCFDAVSGQIIWQRDTVRQDRARVPQWGFAASPLVDGERVIVHVGAEPDGCFLALDRLTGRELWRSVADPAGYCTPLLIEAPSGRQIVAWTPENIRGLDAATGKPLWSVPYKVTYGVSIAGPLYRDGIVFITGYWEGSRAIQLGPRPTEATVIWQERRDLNGLMAQPLYRDGVLYTLDKSNGLMGVDLKSGRRLWSDHQFTKRSRNPHASIVWLGETDRVLMLNAAGELILARLTPEGYQEQSRTKILDNGSWSHPAFAGRRVYARSDGAERWRTGPYEIVCVELPSPN